MRVCAVLLLSLLFAACDRQGYVSMQPVSPYSWEQPVSILVENGDTVSARDIAVALRYNGDFEGDTLTVNVQTSLPDAHQLCERLQLRLAKEYHAAAVTASEAVLYRKHCVLKQSGYYIFTITPTRAVEGVEAVGIEISENGKR